MISSPEHTLYTLAIKVLDRLSDAESRAFIQQFSASPIVGSYLAPAARPDVDMPVAAAEADPTLEHLRKAFVDHHHEVAWGEGYTQQELGHDVNLGGWVPLASSEGPIFADDALLALTVLNANACYPQHRHPPEEMYLTVSGGFWFERQGKEEVWLGPGSVAFTEGNEVHALRNGKAPTLMIACWTGGSFQRSEIIR